MDQQFIELFDASQVWKLVNRDNLPKWDELGKPYKYLTLKILI